MSANRLDGWKEISQYLSRNVRTCQRWEKEYSLPIHRIDQTSDRAKVYAFKAELDLWLKGKSNAGNANGIDRLLKKKIPAVPTIGAFGLIILLAALWLFVFRGTVKNPVNWDIRGQRIVFLDEENRILWHTDVDSNKNLEPYYNDFDQVFLRAETYQRERILISDVRGHGKKDVLVALHHDADSGDEAALFNSRGKKLWSEKARLRQAYPEKSFVTGYNIIDMKLEDIDGDGVQEALILWNHQKRFSSILMIKTRKGTEIFRYEHTGRFQFIKLINLAGRGKHIFLGGTNNLLEGDAVLAVLDCSRLRSGTGPPFAVPSEMAGSESSLYKYVPIDPIPAGHRFYIRFRKNNISKIRRLEWQYVILVKSVGGTFKVHVNSAMGNIQPLYFDFDGGFNLTAVSACADLKRAYSEMVSDGLVTESLQAFLDSCFEDVLFWDGSGWSPAPADLSHSR
jgi:hypothetical protein